MMNSKSDNVVELADRVSRRRARGTTIATLAFVAVQLVARPVFRTDGDSAAGPRAVMWAVNVAVLLLFLLPIGPVVFGRRVRELVNDEVSRANARSAAIVGFALAMVVALAVYSVSPAFTLSAREGLYLVVTPTTTCTLLVFAWLESRANRDG